MNLDEVTEYIKQIQKEHDIGQVLRAIKVLTIASSLQNIDKDLRVSICKELKRLRNIQQILEVGL